MSPKKGNSMKTTIRIWKGPDNCYHFSIQPKRQQWEIVDSHSMASTLAMAKKQAKKICKKLGFEVETIIKSHMYLKERV